jgi:hypothetical protein
MVDHEGASRFATHEKLVAYLNILKARGQRTVWHFDAKELEFLFVIRACDAVGPHERFTLDVHADHDKMAVLELEPRVAGGLKTEKRVVPVIHGGDALRGNSGQLSSSYKGF